ncbi:MAG TPA: hypothetical protein VGP44_03975, partial [Gemmatimonadales bacterium]|nr:hypothetical protein [Gemmatimonadales bacterium]
MNRVHPKGRSRAGTSSSPRRWLVALVAVALLALVVDSAAIGTSTAKTHKRHHHQKRHRLPDKFFGINPNARIPTAGEFKRMKRGGGDSYRAPVYWVTIEGASPGTFNWTSVDTTVENAAAARVDVLPFIWGSPDWLGCKNPVPGSGCVGALPVETPAQVQAWKSFLTAAVARYGPHGQFWREHPLLPKQPIRSWEIWNEENYFYFVDPISPENYARLLKISRSALKSADRGSKVIMGGLFGEPFEKYPQGIYANVFLRRLYEVPGVKPSFDAVGLHPYARDVTSLKRQILGFRSVMKGAGDGATPIWLDEFGWSSRPPSDAALARGIRGQQRQLVAAYKMLI